MSTALGSAGSFGAGTSVGVAVDVAGGVVVAVADPEVDGATGGVEVVGGGAVVLEEPGGPELGVGSTGGADVSVPDDDGGTGVDGDVGVADVGDGSGVLVCADAGPETTNADVTMIDTTRPRHGVEVRLTWSR